MTVDQVRTLDYSISRVCNYFQVSESDLKSRSRKTNVVYARAFIYKFMREIYSRNLSLVELGCYFGRDHCTVLHSIKMLDDTFDCYPELKNEYFSMKKGLII
jgi:chromosomal replication initiation ATPase DnaA